MDPPCVMNTIVVRGFKASTSDDTLLSFFENRRSGGGEIKENSIDRNNNTLTVTFVQPGVADNVLCRHDLTLEGATLEVSQAQDVWDGKTVEVYGLKPSTSYDSILLFFESKQCSDGSEVLKVQRHMDETVAYVTFKYSGVAEKVISMRNLSLDGATLTVQKAKNEGHKDTCFRSVVNVDDTFDDSKTQDVTTTGDSGSFHKPVIATKPRHKAPAVSARAAVPVSSAPSNMVLVRGISLKTTKELLTMFFQSKKRSGGGPLENVDYRIVKHEATLTFCNIEDAQRVLQCGCLSLEGADLTLTEAKVDDKQRNVGHSTTVAENVLSRPDLTLEGMAFKASPALDEWDRKTIEVCGLEPSTTHDGIVLFFESKRCSGGGEVHIVKRDMDKTVARVTFKYSGVAEKVILMPNLCLDDAKLTVQKATNQGRKDAQHVLQCGQLSLEDADLTVTEVKAEDIKRSTKHKTTDVQGAAVSVTKRSNVQNRTPTSTVTEQTSVRIVRITGFKPGTSKDVIEMFVENNSGENELESCDCDEDTGVTVVEFRNPQGATKLMSSSRLELDGAQLTVTALSDVYAGLDRESCRPKAVKVSGIDSHTPKDFISLFFENRHRSGGGEIDDLEYDQEEGLAIITFMDAECASRVAQKESLVIDHVTVHMKLMRPPMCITDVQGPFEDDMFLLSRVSPKCTSDDVKTFFSTSNVDSETERVIFTQQLGVVMLQFSYPSPDFYSLRELCVTKPLRGTMISVQRVAETRQIQVHNIGSLTEETLGLYFENKKRSGGGNVTRIHVYREQDYALVEVADNTTVRNILAVQNHTFVNQTLHVAAFYDCVGLIPPHHDTSMPGGWIPENVTVTGLNARLLNFISTSHACQQLVDNKMADVSAAVEWGSYSYISRSIELTCTITHNMKNAQHLAKTWSQDAPKIFLGVLDREYASEDIDTLQQAWERFAERIGYVDDLDPSNVHVDVDQDACMVHVTGRISEVEGVCSRLKRDHSQVQEEMTRAATIVTEVKSGLDLHCLRMLSAKAFSSEQENKFQDMKVVIDMKSHEVKFTGIPSDVESAKIAMYDILNDMREKPIIMSGLLIGLINGTAMTKYIVKQFKTKRICAVFDNNVDSKTLKVYALKDQDLSVAVKTITIEAVESTFPADVANMSARKKWRELVTKLQSEHIGLLAIKENEDSITLSGAMTPYEEALKEVQDFLADNAKTEKFVDLDYGVVDYMGKYMKEDLNKVMTTNTKVTVTMKTDGRCGCVVMAYGDRHQQAIQQVQTMAKDVKTDQLVIDKPGRPKFLESPTGKHSLKQLEGKHKVVIVDSWKSSQRSAEGGRSMRGSGRGGLVGSKVDLPGGVLVEVVQGDLTTFQADAIVNAANGQLDHCGGLAKAIADAGGPDIQRECRDYVQRSGVLTAGHVYVSTPGQLPCKKVIHAVGPRWHGGRSNEENDLYDAIFESMQAAEKLGLCSIAFPALSCGIFQYPLDKATKTIISALKDFLEDKKHKCVKKVSLVDLSGNIVRELSNSLDMVFGRDMTTSRRGQDSSHKKGTIAEMLTAAKSGLQSFFGGAESQPPESPPHHSRKQADPATTQLNTPEGITLSLCKSELAKEKVEVIVNSTNCQLQLERGYVSKALLDRGGQTLQRECQQNAPDGIKSGEVVVTSGGQLKCQLVIHGACCRWDGGAGRSEQVLRTFLANCFQEADNNNTTSIAIPPIGTGKLGFDPHFVAKVMREELFQFSRLHSQTSLRDVRFVVYQKDDRVIQAFEEVLFKSVPIRHETGRRLAGASPRHDEAAHSQPPQTRPRKPTGPATTELKTPEGITISLRKSEIAKEKVDGIVNSTNRQLQLERGYVSKALLDIGGQTLQNECQQKAPHGVKSGEVVVTSGGKLNCKFVIHGACCRWDGGTGESEKVLRMLLANCFHEADNKKMKSIAIPPIGTGNLGFESHFVAKVMREELFLFSSRNPQTTLRDVRFVVYQKDDRIIQAFEEVLFGSGPNVHEARRVWTGERTRQDEGRFHGGSGEGRTARRQRITFNIYAKSQGVIDRVKQAVQQLCKKECPDVLLNSEEDQAAITKLTQFEIGEILSLEIAFSVKVTIENRKPKKFIRIQGLKADTSQANVKISDIFRRIEVADVKKSQESLIAKMVHWSYSDGTKFTNYPGEINSMLENAYQANNRNHEWKEDNDVTYRVDFSKMIETTRANHNGVPVKRTIVGGDIELPANWTRMGDGENVKLESLHKSSGEYQMVEKDIMRTAGGNIRGVTKVERVQNPTLYRLYVLHRGDMEKRKTKPTTTERSLWHGTSADSIGNINNGGFNRSYCGKNATAYGQGVYFAVNSSYSAQGYASPDASGHKRMYKALVLTGDYTQGNSSMRYLPDNPNNTGFPFDSAIDNPGSPNMFVVFLDNMAYPEYLVTFT